MRRKNLDAIVANDVSRPDIGFESDSNEVRVFFSDGTALDLAKASKDAIATAVWRAICRQAPARMKKASPGSCWPPGCGRSGWTTSAGPPAEGGEAPGPRPRRRGDLDAIRQELIACRGCALCGTRNTVVFGVGNPRARLMFVGEGPGAEEDRQGEPFVGAAGKRLDRWIARIGLSREDVYIANIVKCRPPGNRVPTPDEARSCLPYLIRQIRAIRPEVLCTLGLDRAELPVRRRGEDHPGAGAAGATGTGSLLLPTYHPAFILRDPSRETEVFEDFEAIARRLSPADPRNDRFPFLPRSGSAGRARSASGPDTRGCSATTCARCRRGCLRGSGSGSRSRAGELPRDGDGRTSGPGSPCDACPGGRPSRRRRSSRRGSARRPVAPRRGGDGRGAGLAGPVLRGRFPARA